MRAGNRKWVIGLGALVLVIVVAIALFDWNMLRGPISRYVSQKLDRPFAINGDLHVDLSLHPLVTADYITLANKAWSTEPRMADVQRLAVRIDLLPLLHGQVVLPEVALTAPKLVLERNQQGDANWTFGNEPSTGGALPAIGRLRIEAGSVRYVDPGLKTDITVAVASVAGDQSRDAIQVQGRGTYNGEPFTLKGQAASPLALEQKDRPYEVDLQARAGTTAASYQGTIVPSRADELGGAVSLQGKDVSQLYPLIPVTLPWTPPYRLSGELRHTGGVWSMQQIKGKIGNSDVAGELSVDRNGKRPVIKADLTSQLLDYHDLGGFVGLPPPGAGTRGTPEQKKEVAKQETTGKVLPARPIDLAGLRAADASVHLKGLRVMAATIPLDKLDARLELQNGVLKLQPANFGLGGGNAVLNLVVDGRENIPKVQADATLRNVELARVFPSLKPPKGNAGKLGGRLQFTGHGNSIAEMLASSNGSLALINWGGQASELTMVLSNLDLANAAELLLRGDANASIRCAVADFGIDNGQWGVRTLVVDTAAEKILGQGSADFKTEQYDFRLEAKSKRPSLMALRGPIVVDGSFRTPHVRPAAGPLLARVGASVALGVALTPIAALLPLIDTGGAADADCAGLIEDTQGVADKSKSGTRQGG